MYPSVYVMSHIYIYIIYVFDEFRKAADTCRFILLSYTKYFRIRAETTLPCSLSSNIWPVAVYVIYIAYILCYNIRGDSPSIVFSPSSPFYPLIVLRLFKLRPLELIYFKFTSRPYFQIDS